MLHRSMTRIRTAGEVRLRLFKASGFIESGRTELCAALYAVTEVKGESAAWLRMQRDIFLPFEENMT